MLKYKNLPNILIYKEINAIFKLTSAKEDKGIEDLFTKLSEEIFSREIEERQKQIQLEEETKKKEPKPKSKCC